MKTSASHDRSAQAADAHTLYEAITRMLFGYDVFVSYPREDGADVALALYRTLRQRGYAVFLDQHEGLYGTDLERTLSARLARSQALVVVATSESFASPHVAFEVSSFVEAHARKPRPMIPIGTRELRVSCPWSSLRQVVWIEDLDEVTSNPSVLAALVDKVTQRLVATRREVLLRNALSVAATVFLVVALAALWEWYEATRQRDRALGLRLASRSELLREEQADRLETAALLAAEAALRSPGETFETGRAIVHALDLMAEPPTELSLPSRARLLRFTDTGDALVAVLENGTLWVAGLNGGQLWESGGAEAVAAIVSASTDVVRTRNRGGATRVWTRNSMEQLPWETLPPGFVLSLDAKFALVPDASSEGGSFVVDLDSRTPLIPFTGLDLSDVTMLLVSPEQAHQFVLVGTQRSRSAFLVDRATRTNTRLEAGNVIDLAAFSPDGKAVALGGRNFEVSIFDSAGRNTGRMRHQHFIRSLAFSPDGGHVLTSSGDRTARLLAAGSGIEELRIPHPDMIDAVAYSPRGNQLATVSGTRLRLFPVQPARGWPHLPVDMRDVAALVTTASADPRPEPVQILIPLAVVAGEHVGLVNVRQEQARLYNASTGAHLRQWQLRVRPSALALDRTGRTVFIVTTNGGAWLNAEDDLQRVGDVSSLGQVTTVAVSQEWLLAGGTNGAQALSRTRPERKCDVSRTRNIRAVALVDGSDIAVVGTDRGIDAVKLTTCSSLFAVPHPDPVLAIAVSNDGRWLATGTSDNPVMRVFNIERSAAKERYSIIRQGAIRTIAFSPSGNQLAVGAEDRTTRVYDLRDGAEIGRTSFTVSPWSVAFSPDGTTLRSLTGETDLERTVLVVAQRTLDVSAMLRELCRRAPLGYLERPEWDLYLVGTRYRRTCDQISLRPTSTR
jgi:WD40 repeat protein